MNTAGRAPRWSSTGLQRTIECLCGPRACEWELERRYAFRKSALTQCSAVRRRDLPLPQDYLTLAKSVLAARARLLAGGASIGFAFGTLSVAATPIRRNKLHRTPDEFNAGRPTTRWVEEADRFAAGVRREYPAHCGVIDRRICLAICSHSPMSPAELPFWTSFILKRDGLYP